MMLISSTNKPRARHWRGLLVSHRKNKFWTGKKFLQLEKFINQFDQSKTGSCRAAAERVGYTPPLAWTDIYFFNFWDTCYPSFVLICSHWLTYTILLSYWVKQSANILMLSSYWFSLIKLSLLHMSRLRSQEVLVRNTNFVSLSKAWPVSAFLGWPS